MDSSFQKLGIKGDPVQFQQRQSIDCIVLQLPCIGGFSIPVAQVQAVISRYHLAFDKVMDVDGCIQIGRFLQNLSSLRQCDHGPGIPGKQNLIVLVELCTIYAVVIQLFQPGIVHIPTIF